MMKGHIRCFFTEKTRDAMSVRAWLRLTRRCTPATRARRPGSSTDIHKVKSPSPRHLSTHSISQSFTHPPACRRPPPNAIWAYRPLSESSASSPCCSSNLPRCPRSHICFSPLQESFTGEKSASTLASSTSMRTPFSIVLMLAPRRVLSRHTNPPRPPPLYRPVFRHLCFVHSFILPFFLPFDLHSFSQCSFFSRLLHSSLLHFHSHPFLPSFIPSIHSCIHAFIH